MNNFDKARFCKYANWDLTINWKFYRNFALVISLTLLGTTICSFLLRWACTKLLDSPMSDLGLTGFVLFSILSIALLVTGGCVFHPLRNKQGRITHLTIPATSLEKYVWHILVCFFGTIVLGVASVAISDGLNALLTWWVMGGKEVHSLFVATFTPSDWLGMHDVITYSNMSGDYSNIGMSPDPWVTDYANSLVCALYAGIFLQTSIYTFGNSLMYKYNIPVTYIVLQLIGFVCFALFMIGTIVLGNYVDGISQETWNTFIKSWPVLTYVGAVISIILGVLFYFWAYKRYTKAQLIAILNK